jgi:hypothetical protein
MGISGKKCYVEYFASSKNGAEEQFYELKKINKKEVGRFFFSLSK